MSWVSKIQTEMVITTGDGKQYKPTWLNAEKDIQYNVSFFEFSNIDGTLVQRKRVKGTRFSLEIHFIGDNHLDVSEAFEISSRDKRAWTIQHPLYGNLIVQPIGLKFDNKSYNITKITGVVVQTIKDEFPNTSVLPTDQVLQSKSDTDAFTSGNYANSNKNPSLDDISEMDVLVDNYDSTFTKLMQTDDENNKFQLLLSQARSAIIRANTDPLTAAKALQDVVDFPSKLVRSVNSRVVELQNEFTRYTNSFDNLVLGTITRTTRLLYELQGAALILGLAVARSTPETDSDYPTRAKVLEEIDFMLNFYNTYLVKLDEFQTDTADEPDSFVPNSDSMFNVDKTVNEAVSNLFDIAFNARQQRTVILERDSNIINLTHRFYGLADEVNIATFMENNNIGISEILNIRKDRELTYLV